MKDLRRIILEVILFGSIILAGSLVLSDAYSVCAEDNTIYVYRTKTGGKYHSGKCGNGTFYVVTLEEAQNSGLQPCTKCGADKMTNNAVISSTPTPTPISEGKNTAKISLNQTNVVLYLNHGINDTTDSGKNGNIQEVQLTVKISDKKNDYQVKWKSGNSKIAKVDSKGKVTPVAVGETKIVCTVTNKTTKKVVQTLEAKITVNANAEKIAIVDAKKYDGTTICVGDVMKLSSRVWDAKGKYNTTKKTYVTDLVQWVVKTAKGKNAGKAVTIDQKTGKITFHKTGEYIINCYAYQSSKYKKATATSAEIKIIVVNATEKAPKVENEEEEKTVAEAVMVWIPTDGGRKYHIGPGCSQMEHPIEVTITEAKKQGFTACKKCNPPVSE